MKGQILANFIVDSTGNQLVNAIETLAHTAPKETLPLWDLYNDGSSSKEGLGIGMLLMP